MQEMDRRVALLRLLLSDITARERQALENGEQLRIQMSRIVDVSVRQNAPVMQALSFLAEVEERLAQQEMVLRHLGMIRERAQSELNALLVTQRVTDAHLRLAELQRRRTDLMRAKTDDSVAPEAADTQAQSSELAAIDAEIHELEAAIEHASEAAARALTAGKREHRQQPQLHTGEES
jgi:hypothetical protein